LHDFVLEGATVQRVRVRNQRQPLGCLVRSKVRLVDEYFDIANRTLY
jgi:hypothetical protein